MKEPTSDPGALVDQPAGIPVPQTALDEITALYDRGLYLQAYRHSLQWGPPHTWIGTPSRILAGRLAANLGGPRLCRRLHLLAWRADPTDPEAIFFGCYAYAERRGALAAWNLARRIGDLEQAEPSLRAQWLAFLAVAAAQFRDFDTAESYLARADKLDGQDPWVWVERAAVLNVEDRYEESLAAARQSLQLRPDYRPGVQAVAHALTMLGRDQEAIELLQDAAGRLESAAVLAQLATLQMEIGRYPEARAVYDRIADLCPMMEKHFAKWLAANRSDAACQCGDLQASAALAREVDSPFHRAVADRMAAADASAKCVLLPVGFVRQHHMTCGPATLTAIARFWSRPAEHLDIVEQICYDGTPPYRERAWAESTGWAVREFTVTWDSAVALLDRGVPFTLTTVEPSNAHLQAAIGYDSRRGTLLIRDPYMRVSGEFAAEAFFERYRATGPRGMVLVPRDESHRLDGIELPDAELYDRFYIVQQGLDRHDRAAAMAACDQMAQLAPGHRLTLWARRCIAGYDADPVRQMECAEKLLELFPGDPIAQLTKLSLLRNLARRDQRLALLKEICDKPTADPVFWQQYAQELTLDPQHHERAERLLRRCLRYRPADSGNCFVLANLLWQQQRFDEAMELYRFAACLGEREEQLAQAFFSTSRLFRRTEEALDFLRRRFQRLGDKSGQPGWTLFRAYEALERTGEAFATLEEAAQRRPDDGDLALQSADAYGRRGDFEKAEKLLAAAAGKCHPGIRLRAAASLAAYRGELKQAVSLWRQVLDSEPLAIEAQRAVAQLTAETESRAAALRHLDQQIERFPYHCLLHQLRIEWLRDEDPAVQEEALRRLIEINPADAWAHRELALALSHQRRHDEALAEADEAMRLEPGTTGHGVRAAVRAAAGRIDPAREDCREAIRLSVDNDNAVVQWMDLCHTSVQRREALHFVQQELVRQVIFGDGLLVFRHYASGVFAPDELLGLLREAHAARPDLWHAWAALVRQLVEENRLDEALEIARAAVERFPLLPALRLELATVQQLKGNAEGELDSLERARHVSPGWATALRRLAAAHERRGQLEEAQRVLEDSVAWNPLDAGSHAALAAILWKMHRPDDALSRIQQAIRLERGSDWIWQQLHEWCHHLRRPELVEQLARDLAQRRAGDARSWLVLARTLAGPEHQQERLACIDKAVDLEPRNVEAHDQRVRELTEAGRFDEALAACAPPTWGAEPPLALRGRAAWVLAYRGDMAAAIERMKKIVEEEPSYYWGWHQLTQWARDTGDNDGYLECAQQLIRLAPHDPVAYGFWGDACERLKRPAEAKTAYRRAVELQPDYSFGALSLFDLLLQGSELDEAAAVLSQLRRHLDSDLVRARAVQLEVRRGDRKSALAEFRTLCTDTRAEPLPLRIAVEALAERKWHAAGEQILFDTAWAAPDHETAAQAWVLRLGQRKEFGRIRRGLEQLRKHAGGACSMGWRRACAAWLEELGRVYWKLRHQNNGWVFAGPLRRRVRQYWDVLHGPSETWMAIGCALNWAGLDAMACEWMSDWRSRPDATPETLACLVDSLRSCGRDDEAFAVSTFAMNLRADSSTLTHRLWLAGDALLHGQTARGRQLTENVEEKSLMAYQQFIHLLAQAMLPLQEWDGRIAKSACFAAARRRIRQAAQANPDFRKNRALERFRRRVISRVAADRGGFLGRLWAFCTF